MWLQGVSGAVNLIHCVLVKKAHDTSASQRPSPTAVATLSKDDLDSLSQGGELYNRRPRRQVNPTTTQPINTRISATMGTGVPKVLSALSTPEMMTNDMTGSFSSHQGGTPYAPSSTTASPATRIMAATMVDVLGEPRSFEPSVSLAETSAPTPKTKRRKSVTITQDGALPMCANNGSNHHPTSRKSSRRHLAMDNKMYLSADDEEDEEILGRTMSATVSQLLDKSYLFGARASPSATERPHHPTERRSSLYFPQISGLPIGMNSGSGQSHQPVHVATAQQLRMLATTSHRMQDGDNSQPGHPDTDDSQDVATVII